MSLKTPLNLKIRDRNEAMYPKPNHKLEYNDKKYLEDKYRGKGNSIAMRSHRCNDIKVELYNKRVHYDDILMHRDDIIVDKNILGRLLEVFNTDKTLVRIKDIDGTVMFDDMPRYETEENVLYYQLVAAGFVLLPGNKFLFLRNNEKHSRLKNVTTMVQGHVETSFFISSMSAKQYVEYELCRELVEEVEVSRNGIVLDVAELAKRTNLEKVIYTMIDNVSREHVGALSIIDLRDMTGLAFKTKEDTHDVLIGSIDEIIEVGNLDIWSSIVIDAISDGTIRLKTNIKGEL